MWEISVMEISELPPSQQAVDWSAELLFNKRNRKAFVGIFHVPYIESSHCKVNYTVM